MATEVDRKVLIRRLKDFTSRFSQPVNEQTDYLELKNVENADLTADEIDASLIFHGFEPEDIEETQKALLRLIENRRPPVDVLGTLGITVSKGVSSVARFSAEAIDKLRNLLMPSMMELSLARRGDVRARRGDVPAASEPPERVRIKNAFVAAGIMVIPVGWQRKGKGKTEFMLYSVTDWPAESISANVTIDDQPVTVSADQSKKHRLIYLTLDIDPVKLASCDIMLVNGVLTLQLQTARAAGAD